MNNLIIESRQLNRMIKNSKEYSRYIYARNSLKTNDELYARVKEFKRRNMEIQTFVGDNPYDEILRLTNENDELVHNSLVSEYLRAESCLCRLMRDMFKEITAELKFDYLDD